jgi:hypothetical protein
MSRIDAIRELEQQLLGAEVFPELLRLFRNHFDHATDNVYVLAHVPEQLEDIFELLVDGDQVVHVETPRE